eukprot:1179394-Pleurochrysis_carterae.AAC.1
MPPTDDDTPRHDQLHFRSRSLLASRNARLNDRHVRGMPNSDRHVGFVVDSGCTYHIHPDVRDLINVRSCKESVSGVDAVPRPCTAIGDMP